MLANDNLAAAFFTYFVVFSFIMYSYNIRQSLKLLSNYAGLVLILAYISTNTVYALPFYDDY